MSGPLEVWHFTEKPGVLRDGSTFEVGKPLPPLNGEVIVCTRGYHGSPSVLNALQYAQGPHLYRRTLSGVIVPHGDPLDKYAASEAVATAYRDATPLLRLFARQCALDCLHLWKAPKIVRDYLATGDEDLRSAARDAARAAARAAARDAARDAAWDAAWDAQKQRLESWAFAFIRDGTLPEIEIPECAR